MNAKIHSLHPKTQPLSRQYLSPKQAAERLGMSLCTMYRKLNSGEIQSWKRGHMVRIPIEALEEWVAAGTGVIQ